ncbi:MAG: transporter [Armatimonadetes bacterium]|nr:transporter [Armatimonadota bacterium]
MKNRRLLSQKNQTIVIAFLCEGLILLPSKAFAGPPWNVDDPGTTPFRHTIAYLSYSSSRLGNNRTDSLPSLGVTYGLTDRSELGFGFGALIASTANGGTDYGFGDSAVSLKHRFVDQGNLQVAIAYQATFPTGASSKRLGSGAVDQGTWLTASYQLGKFQVAANAGLNAFGSGTRRDSPLYGVVGLCQVSPNTQVGVQVYGDGPKFTGDHGELAYGVGATHDLSAGRRLQAQVGRSLRGKSDLNLYLGMTIEYGSRRDRK